jgi:DNA polymerase alpha subunit A
LVLEPKKGLYDKYVVMLDFNSLYPSIIQEYNICFTTVDRQPPTLTSSGEGGSGGGEEEEEDGWLPEVPTSGGCDEMGILPRVIRHLVQRRRAVKNSMKSERDAGKKEQMNIRQLALKILANSMYGCLGFSNSRFYAKPIAALVTSQGREILQNTMDLAQDTIGLDVIYGDTDSIMIYTGSTDYQKVISLGNQVKREVNKLYRQLEIEIDGVFAMMLLLKKKKYAALLADYDASTKNLSYTKETKGLDMVRRDWCVLSRQLGARVLDEILQPGRETEEVVVSIHELLTSAAESARDGTLELGQYVITRA